MTPPLLVNAAVVLFSNIHAACLWLVSLHIFLPLRRVVISWWMLRCLVCCCIDVRISYLMVHVLNSDITWFLPPTWKIFQLESHYHQTHLSGYYGTWSCVSTYLERPLIHVFYFTLCVSKRDQTADVHLSRLSTVWLGSRVVGVLDSGAECPGSNRSRDAVR